MVARGSLDYFLKLYSWWWYTLTCSRANSPSELVGVVNLYRMATFGREAMRLRCNAVVSASYELCCLQHLEAQHRERCNRLRSLGVWGGQRNERT